MEGEQYNEATEEHDSSTFYHEKEGLLNLWFNDLEVGSRDNGDYHNEMKQIHINGLKEFQNKVVERYALKQNEHDVKEFDKFIMGLIGNHAVYWGEIYAKNAISHAKAYFLSSMDFWCLPNVINNKIGILYTIEHSNWIDIITSATLFYDDDYNHAFGKCIFKECSNSS